MLCTTKCVLCDMFEEEDMSHMLWRCKEHTIHREMALKELESVMPPAMWFSFSIMTDEEKSRFLLTGLIEWHDIYLSIINLTWSIYITTDNKKLKYSQINRLTKVQCFNYLKLYN